MGYRRSPEEVKSARDWRDFVACNQELIDSTGAPLVVFESIAHWDDFLMHGYLDHHNDPTEFVVDQLNERQYQALAQLVEIYFGSGYSYFTPIALRSEDERRMYKKFDKK